MRLRWIFACLALVATAACSDDSATNNANNVNNSNNVNNVNNVNNINNLNNVNNSNNSNNANNTNNQNNTNNAVDMGSDLAVEDMGFDLDAPDFSEQTCFFPDNDPNCPQGPFGGTSFLSEVVVVGDTSCCYDLNGDGNLDNKVGGYLATANMFGAPVNTNIAAAIQAGALAYLLTYSDLSNDAFDLNFTLDILLGADSDLDFSDNLAGLGSFTANMESFDNSGDPKWTCRNARVYNGHLTATGCNLELFFPGLLDEVRIALQDTIIEADIVPTPDFTAGGRVTLANGILGGALPRDGFYESLNAASLNCACLNKATFEYDAQTDRYQCAVKAEDAAACANDSSGCQFLANQQSCTLLSLVSSDVDVDTDGDQTNDAFSIGVTFEAKGASLIGTN